MTPIEIFEYKQKWMSSTENNPVSFHSDYRALAKHWCKTELEKHQWTHHEYTDVYEDTMFFESKENAKKIQTFLKKFERNR